MRPQQEILQRFESAMETLLTKLKQDPYVIAVVLYGSLSYDTVWEKSDIDLCIVTQETRKTNSQITLVEEGINIHATLYTRSEFKKAVEGAVQGSFLHSMLMKGKLLFTRDEALEEIWANRLDFGKRDQKIQLLIASIAPVVCLSKTQKWLFVRNDPHYSFVFLLGALNGIATIETVLAGDIPTREVIPQALKHNPALFHELYIDLLDSPKTPERLARAISQIENYLREKVSLLFCPIFDYLSEAEAPRSVSELSHHFAKQMNFEGAFLICEWLADEGYLQKVAVPARLVDKSKLDLEEAAYYYDGSPL